MPPTDQTSEKRKRISTTARRSLSEDGGRLLASSVDDERRRRGSSALARLISSSAEPIELDLQFLRTKRMHGRHEPAEERLRSCSLVGSSVAGSVSSHDVRIGSHPMLVGSA